jgi:hypothetical protein
MNKGINPSTATHVAFFVVRVRLSPGDAQKTCAPQVQVRYPDGTPRPPVEESVSVRYAASSRGRVGIRTVLRVGAWSGPDSARQARGSHLAGISI